MRWLAGVVASQLVDGVTLRGISHPQLHRFLRFGLTPARWLRYHRSLWASRGVIAISITDSFCGMDWPIPCRSALIR
jgi:hypothetical protein